MRRLTTAALLGLVAACSAPATTPAGDGAGGDPGGGAGGSGAIGGGGGTSGDGGAGLGFVPGPRVPPSSARLAQGLAITGVAVFQGVKVPVAQAGVKVTARPMPVVANRPGLVRAYVAPGAGWQAHAVSAELHLVGAPGGFPVLRDSKVIARASAEADLGSTFNFDVPGASLPGGVTYFIELIDGAAPSVATSSRSDAQYPPSGGVEALGATDGGGALRVKLVPIAYGVDGTGRVPDTSAAVLQGLHDRILELYPVPSVDLTVRAPVAYAKQVLADGTNWDDLLLTVTEARMGDRAPADVYYYAGVAPQPTLDGFCPGGTCVHGLSNLVTSATDGAQRASVGLLYADARTYGTAPHEIGHAHGRSHAPCGNAPAPDPNFPYPNAGVGVWGYSILSKQLMDPATHVDQMSYCQPAWQSDYSFAALFDRGQRVNVGERVGPSWDAPVAGGALDRSGAPALAPYRIVRIAADGALSWRGEARSLRPEDAGGEARPARFLDGSGAEVATAIARVTRYDHLGGGFALVPLPSAAFASVVLDGVGALGRP